jgi:hypothetical protein
MELIKYKNAGAIIAEDLSPNENDDYSYTYIETENTPFGKRIVNGLSSEIDYNSKHDFIMQTGVFTVGAKVRSNASGVIFRDSIISGSGDNDTFWIMQLYHNAGVMKAEFSMHYNDTPFETLGQYTIPDFAYDKFYTIMVTGDGSTLNMYIDGILVESGTVTPEILATQVLDTRTYGGVDVTQPDYVVSDLLVFNRPLTAQEALGYHLNSTFDVKKNIVTRWVNDLGTSFVDSSWKAENSGTGFDASSDGDYSESKNVGTFNGTTSNVDYPSNFAGVPLTDIEFDFISTDTDGTLMGSATSNGVYGGRFKQSSVFVTNSNMGTVRYEIDETDYGTSLNQGTLYDLIGDGLLHHIKMYNINLSTQFTVNGSLRFMSVQSTYYTQGQIFNITIDKNQNGVDHSYAGDDVTGYTDLIGSSDLTETAITYTPALLPLPAPTVFPTIWNGKTAQQINEFDGIVYLTIEEAFNDAIADLSEITFTAWIKKEVNEADYGILSLNSALDTAKFEIITNAEGGLDITLDTGSGQTVINTDSVIRDTNWHYITVSVDFPNDEVNTFVDGQLIDTSTGTGGLNFGSTSYTEHYLATNADQTLNFTGSIGDMQFYDSALTQIQISDLMNGKTEDVDAEVIILPWDLDISTMTYETRLSVEAQINESSSKCFMSSDGLHIYADGLGVDKLFQYNLTVPYDLNSASYYGTCTTTVYNNNYPYGLYISDDGVHGYSVKGATNDSIYINQYVFATPFDILTMTRVQFKEIPTSGYDFDPRDLMFVRDGSRFICISGRTNTIAQVSLSTPWDVSTATLDGTIAGPVNLQGSSGYLSRDGLYMIAYAFNDETKQLKLNTANNVLDGMVVDTGVTDGQPLGSPKGYNFDEYGGKLYRMEEVSFVTYIYQYSIDRI